MKRLPVLICLVLFALYGSAQKLAVESFSEMTNDLSASTTPRVDNNGTPCALVKVQLASAIAQFEGLVMGDPVYKTSEYWVYMAAGSKKLTIKLEGYLPLSVYFDNYGITSLESKTTYSMVITGIVASVQPQQEVRTRTGWIILDSYPQGASAYINGDFVGTTPLNNYKQPYGSYSYRLDKPNYHSVTGTIELNSNRFEKTEKLLPAFGAISVTSSVNGASVLLDGKSTDRYTPCTLDEIPSGQHTITVQLDKYAPKQISVTVEDGKTAVVNAALDARFASIVVRSLNGASIYIDDVFQGTSSCAIELMEGYYDIEVRLDHHKTVTEQIQVVAGQPQTLELFPVPIYGSLDIMSTPHNASITIDGKPYGKTPFTVEQLLEGDHTVTLSLEGHSTETCMVTISENKTESLTATLQKGREITITCPTAGSHIFINGSDVGESPYCGILSYGTYTTYAVVGGKKTQEQTIISSEGVGSLPDVVLSSFDNKTFTVKGVSFTMIAIEGGTFTMGATNEMLGRDKKPTLYDQLPTHKVTLSNYYIGKTEVTQALWKVVMGGLNWDDGENYPVRSISWNDCIEFIRRLNSLTGATFRLPTEAEWEYAARGGNKSRGYWLSGGNDTYDVAWYKFNVKQDYNYHPISPCPVATKRPNELGIYDMSGNVCEWCSDWYDQFYYQNSPLHNPTGPSSPATYGHRVFRGFGYRDVGHPTSERSHLAPDKIAEDLGLRLALD